MTTVSWFGSFSNVLGQKVKVIDIAFVTDETNRTATLKHNRSRTPELFVGTRKGNVFVIELEKGKLLKDLKPMLKPKFLRQTGNLVKNINLRTNSTSYLLKSDGIYSLRAGSWKQILNIKSRSFPQIKNSTAEAELWGMGFVNEKRVCTVGIYFKEDAIEKELLVCTNDITKPKWISSTPPQDSKVEYIQLTDIFFNKNSQGWVVGTDTENGIIWHSKDGGKSWNEEEYQLSQPLLKIDGNKKSLFAIGLKGLVVKKNISDQIEKDSQTLPLKNRETLKIGDEVEIDLEKLTGNPNFALKLFGTVAEKDKGNKTEKIRISDVTISSSIIEFNDFIPFFEKIYFNSKDVKKIEVKKTEEKWREIQAPTTMGLNDIKFTPDGKYGFIVGQNGTILYSTDNGEKWRPIKNNKLNKINLYSISIDEKNNHCYIVGSQGAIVKIEYM